MGRVNGGSGWDFSREEWEEPWYGRSRCGAEPMGEASERRGRVQPVG